MGSGSSDNGMAMALELRAMLLNDTGRTQVASHTRMRAR